jgi:NhaP-type Na+/H+ or K+/H+ antiporter
MKIKEVKNQISDAVTVSLYSSTVAFTGPVQVNESHYGMAALAFLVKSFGGLLIGIFFGLLSALATRTTQHHRSTSRFTVSHFLHQGTTKTQQNKP